MNSQISYGGGDLLVLTSDRLAAVTLDWARLVILSVFSAFFLACRSSELRPTESRMIVEYDVFTLH